MSRTKEFIKNVGYSAIANLISLFVSVLTTLLVPKFLGTDIEGYGYLQIYMFYISYLGFFHLGWCDGIFLKLGGKKYSDLKKGLYSSQFWLLTVVEILVAVAIVIFGFLTASNEEYLFIYMAFAANLIIYMPRLILQYYLQTTNRIREYASITTFGRTIYGISIIFVILLCNQNYEYFVYGDLIGKFFALILAIYWNRSIIFAKPDNFSKVFPEVIDNIRIGIKLMFANIASLLISGIVRWGIQQKWSVETYGKVSLTINISSLLMTFISAVSLTLYPTLRRTEYDKLPKLYLKIRNLLMTSLFAMLILYYPLKVILSIWLPQYAESLKYMAILFPLCVYSANMQLLVTTYMNVLRMEKTLLRVNFLGVIFAGITTFLSVFVLNNITMAMVSIVLNQIFRDVYAELILSKKLKIELPGGLIWEIFLTTIFIVCNWTIGGFLGIIIYSVIYLLYFMTKRISFFQDVNSILKISK